MKKSLKDLDIIANSDEPINIDMNLLNYGYCAKVRELYRNYKNNQMSLDDCKKAKAEITREYEKIVDDKKSSSKIYSEYQGSIKKSEILRAEINKSNDLQEMLLKSLECISLITGDETFYKINSRKVSDNNEIRR